MACMLPGTANILLSHNPNTFDRAAELGIDLSLAGHTHGGQVALEYISPDLCPARLITPYVRGWFQKGQFPALRESRHWNHLFPRPLRLTAGNHRV